MPSEHASLIRDIRRLMDEGRIINFKTEIFDLKKSFTAFVDSTPDRAIRQVEADRHVFKAGDTVTVEAVNIDYDGFAVQINYLIRGQRGKYFYTDHSIAFELMPHLVEYTQSAINECFEPRVDDFKPSDDENFGSW